MKNLVICVLIVITVPMFLVANYAEVAASSIIDYRAYTIWSTEFNGELSGLAVLYDFNNDQINDVAAVGNHTIVLYDGATGDIIYRLDAGEAYVYSMVMVGDTDNNGYNEAVAVVLDTASGTISFYYVEPGTTTTIAVKTYSTPDPSEYDLLRPMQNTIYEYPWVEVALPGIKIVSGYPPQIIQRTWIYGFNVADPGRNYTSVIDGRMYTLWSNIVPSDRDGDGLLDIDTGITVEGYFRIEIGFSGIEVNGGIEVANGSTSWSKSFTNLIPAVALEPYSTPNKVLVSYVKVYPTASGLEFRGLWLVAYRVLDGGIEYSIDIGSSRWVLNGFSLAGPLIALDLYDKSSGKPCIELYSSKNGSLVSTEYFNSTLRSISSASIGDLDNDSLPELLIGVGDKLFLYSLYSGVDYLGKYTGRIVVNDGTAYTVGGENRYAIGVEIDSLSYRVLSISLGENDTTPPEITIIEPMNNSFVEIPFKVKARVTEDLSNITCVELYIYIDGTLVYTTNMSYLPAEDIYVAEINYTLSDDICTIVVRACNDNRLSSNTSLYVKVDTSPPELNILSSPANGSRVLYTVYISGSVHDRFLSNLTIRVNGLLYDTLYPSEDEAIEVAENISLEGISDGEVVITLEAMDLSGKKSSTNLVFAKDTNPPTVLVGGIGNNSLVAGPVNITLSVEDQLQVNTTIYLDESPYMNISGTGVYTLYLDTSRLSDGEHVLEIRSIDYIGLPQPLISKVAVNFRVDNNPPMISIDIPIEYREYTYRYNNYTIVISRPIMVRLSYSDYSLDKLDILYIFPGGKTKNFTYRFSEWNISSSTLLQISLDKNLSYTIIAVNATDKIGHYTFSYIVLVAEPKVLIEINTGNAPATRVDGFDRVFIIKQNTSVDILYTSSPIDINVTYNGISVNELVHPIVENIVIEVYSYSGNGSTLVERIKLPNPFNTTNTYIYNYTFPRGGLLEINASAILLGSIESRLVYVAVDSEAPKINSIEYNVSGNQVTVTWNTSDDIGVAEVCISIDNGVNTTSTNPAGSITFTLPSPGSYTLFVKAVDYVGNTVAKEETITIEASKTPTETTPTSTANRTTETPESTTVQGGGTTTSATPGLGGELLVAVMAVALIAVASIYLFVFRRQK